MIRPGRSRGRIPDVTGVDDVRRGAVTRRETNAKRRGSVGIDAVRNDYIVLPVELQSIAVVVRNVGHEPVAGAVRPNVNSRGRSGTLIVGNVPQDGTVLDAPAAT